MLRLPVAVESRLNNKSACQEIQFIPSWYEGNHPGDYAEFVMWIERNLPVAFKSKTRELINARAKNFPKEWVY